MIISRTPFRISLFGGGTDFPEFFRTHTGAVIGTTIDKYIYHSVLPFPSKLFDHRIHVSYSQIERVLSIDSLQHGPYRETLRYMGIEKDIELHVASDLPNLSGLGTSSAFTVGLLRALYALKLIDAGPRELSLAAIHLEREVLKEVVGCQDQVFAAYGGFNLISFGKDEKIEVERVQLYPGKEEELNKSLMLFYTGIRRSAQSIERSKLENMSKNLTKLKTMLAHVEQAYKILTSSAPLTELGNLLDRTWHEKRLLDSSVSNKVIDEMYFSAKKAGAVGGKLLGAGAGGFLLLFVPPEKQDKVEMALHGKPQIRIKVNSLGSNVVYRS